MVYQSFQFTIRIAETPGSVTAVYDTYIYIQFKSSRIHIHIHLTRIIHYTSIKLFKNFVNKYYNYYYYCYLSEAR